MYPTHGTVYWTLPIAVFAERGPSVVRVASPLVM